jgi:diguanylate cyclase (GGDEF)-like protein
MARVHTSTPVHGPVRVARSALTSCEERGVLACVFYLAGGLMGLVAANDPASNTAVLLTVAVIALTVSVVSLLARRWFVYAATLVSSALGPPLIAIAIVAGRGGWASAVAAAIYAFVAVHTSLVLRWRHAAVLLLWGTVTALVAARLIAPELPLLPMLASYLLICGTLAGVTTWLVQALQRQAATDPLTGLANRATFHTALEYACATVLRTDEPLSLIVLDLDGFKQVNDRRGHAAGDDLLIATSRAWFAELRARDVLARVGGDEFCVILPGADLDVAEEIARRLVQVMPVGTSCSAGTATWTPGIERSELISAADAAMYAAKARRSVRSPDEPGR